MPSHYDLLGIPPDAPMRDVQDAYEMHRRHAALAGPESTADAALVARFDEAWRVLGDPALRHEYDRSLGLVAGPEGIPGPAPGQAPGGWGAPAGRTVFACRLCGSTPASNGRFRRVQGLVVLMRWSSLEGPFCRDCGLAVFRDMTARTLLQGWWGVLAVFANVFALLGNLAARARFATLDPPERHPEAAAPNARPLDPGKPLTRRPAILMTAVPLALLVAIGIAIAGAAGGGPTKYVGRCIEVTSSDNVRFVACSGAHDGQVVAQMSADLGPELCPAGSDGYIRRAIEDLLLCVDADK